ncbi:MAG: hypothetical protein QOD62_2909 [Actinomycetota bacterium]|nr:hypothetical protein [Actinomycetota bacterium]
MAHFSDHDGRVEALLAEAKDRGRRLRSHRRNARLGGAGVVLLLAVLAAVFVTRSPTSTKVNVGGPTTPIPAGSSVPGPTLPPTPGPSSTGTPASPSSTTTPACQASSLQAQGSWQGAGGSMAGGVSFVNVGKDSCFVEGQPTIELFDQHGQRLNVVAAQPSVAPLPPTRVLLAPRSTPASVLVQWFNWCGTDPGPVGAKAILPSATASITVTPPIGLIPHCNNAASPSTIDVGSFTQG